LALAEQVDLADFADFSDYTADSGETGRSALSPRSAGRAAFEKKLGRPDMAGDAREKQQFFVEIIKPSHYDDDGYVIQWFRAFVPSNSLACLYALALDVKERQALGGDVEVVVNAYDEIHTVIPTRKIIQRIADNGGRGVVLLAGVQSNQFPRATDLAREFRRAGIQVAIGGFHVSGCLAMLSEMPEDIQSLQALGVTLFAGEAEGRMEGLLRDAYRATMQPVYNYLGDLPELQGQVTPTLPREVARRYMFFAPFDCGRGCPFQCSFCTIINVQGRKSRYRDVDDLERVVRAGVAQGMRRFFITDDNLSRNKNWEAIFDRLIEIRQRENVRLKFAIQVDAMSHKIPGFIDKAARAGCNRVFVGLENINPDNLAAANKPQNRVSEYRAMLQAWRSRGAVIYAGYIIGLPGDTPESVERDIKTIQRELPVDILHFTILTPLPGSADHQRLYQSGAWMDPDLNKYDLEHVTSRHGKMSAQQWQQTYHRAWELYYSWEHVQTLLRRARAGGAGPRHVAHAILSYCASYRFEHMHPMQCGLWRRKVRATRRPGLPKENPLVFHFRRAWELVWKYVSLARYYFKIERIRKRVEQDPSAPHYTDAALLPADAPPQDGAAGLPAGGESLSQLPSAA
jgi:radical SAM superfamily enzyme YgiQ (UPF0313 family)